MLDRSLRNPINWAFVRPLKVLTTLGNRFFTSVGEVDFWFVEDKKTEYGIDIPE